MAMSEDGSGPPAPSTRRRWIILVGAAALVVVLVLGGGLPAGRSAVPRPASTQRCRGGRRRQRLCRRQRDQRSADVGARVEPPDGGAAHRRHFPKAWRWTVPATCTSPTWATIGW